MKPKNQNDVFGLILAGGKGKRINLTHVNKVVLDFNGKPLVQYGIDLFRTVSSKIFLVIGAYSNSVIQTVERYNPDDKNIGFIMQEEQLGTGHAVTVAVEYMTNVGIEPKYVLVGYGDHLMFYPQSVLDKLLNAVHKTKTVISLVTTHYERPEELSWGHILRNQKGLFIGFVEHKDADEKQKQITELNAGLYCFNFTFLLETKDKLKKSDVSGEYYINDFADLALEKGMRVETITVPFNQVGIGINTIEQKIKSEHYYKTLL